MNQKDRGSSDDELIQAYLENEATPEGELQFRRRLGEEAFRRRVAEQAIDLAVLLRGGEGGEETRKPRVAVQGGRRRVLAMAAVAASLLLGFVAIRTLLLKEKGPIPTARDEVAASPPGRIEEVSREGQGREAHIPLKNKEVIGHVVNVIGKVLTGTSLDSADCRVVTEELGFRSGDVLETVGAESFAVLKFDDNSVLAVAGNTRLSCTTKEMQKRVMVHEGDLMAQVAPQPARKPMLIETPVAHAEVVGTTLSLFASLVMTELAVMEGQVRLQRLSDDETVVVNEGESAVATKDAADGALVAKPISPVPAVWDEDFEAQWPKRWRAGHWVNYGLPPGSQHAVRAEVNDQDDGHAFIITENEWSQGLFRIMRDTHLNLTYKLNHRRWFYIRIDTRTGNPTGAYSGDYFFQNPKLWNIPLHKWRTVSVPLREFFRPQKGEEEAEKLVSPNVDDVVFCLLLRTQAPDPELFVDRIWVTKGPADGAIVLKSPRRPLKASNDSDKGAGEGRSKPAP